MTRYHFSELAAEDLSEIWTFIANDNRDAADRVAAAIYAACDFLADRPEAGQEREDLTSLPLRFWLLQAYRNYWIVCDPAAKPIQIIRILHGAREISTMLK
jgi:antitoxin ParD1/3/4